MLRETFNSAFIHSFIHVVDKNYTLFCALRENAIMYKTWILPTKSLKYIVKIRNTQE